MSDLVSLYTELHTADQACQQALIELRAARRRHEARTVHASAAGYTDAYANCLRLMWLVHQQEMTVLRARFPLPSVTDATCVAAAHTPTCPQCHQPQTRLAADPHWGTSTATHVCLSCRESMPQDTPAYSEQIFDWEQPGLLRAIRAGKESKSCCDQGVFYITTPPTGPPFRCQLTVDGRDAVLLEVRGRASGHDALLPSANREWVARVRATGEERLVGVL